MQDLDHTTRSSGASSTATDTAQQASESAKHTAREVAGTARQEGQRLAGQVGDQARSVASDVRRSVAGQVHTGNQKLADGLRRIADDLGTMSIDQKGSPAGQLVERLSDAGRRGADYLEERGPEGLLDDVQDFARRRPGAFLLTAVVAGFAVGRLGRTTVAAARTSDSTAGRDADYRAAADVYSGSDTSAVYGTAPPAPTGGPMEDPYATPVTTPPYDPRAERPAAVGTASVDDPIVTPERGDYR